MEREPASRYWFPAKRYGWGWGLPATWQGWAVLAAYAALQACVALAFPPSQEQLAFFVVTGALALALIAVCWAKGEPPRWRWGGK